MIILETYLWQALKDKLKEIFDKIAPPAISDLKFTPKISGLKLVGTPCSASNKEKVTQKVNLNDIENDTKKKLVYLYDEPNIDANSRKRIRVINFSMSCLKKNVAKRKNGKTYFSHHFFKTFCRIN